MFAKFSTTTCCALLSQIVELHQPQAALTARVGAATANPAQWPRRRWASCVSSCSHREPRAPAGSAAQVWAWAWRRASSAPGPSRRHPAHARPTRGHRTGKRRRLAATSNVPVHRRFLSQVAGCLWFEQGAGRAQGVHAARLRGVPLGPAVRWPRRRGPGGRRRGGSQGGRDRGCP